METAVKIKNLTKIYKIYSTPLKRVADAFTKRKSYEEFVALKDLTVDIPKGEVIGILGKNGSGKSTLLKIITGVTQQTKGSVKVNGRVAAMLELTSGFDGELTGIENIYLKALSMGIPKHEIEKKMDEIISFADIGEHINHPVKTYSSGMKARLGFAVSVNVDPDILVVDEVLSVGDDIFKLKCIEKMKQFRQQGKTILFVSHSLFTVKAFCTKGMWINNGVLMEYGDLGNVILDYETFLKEEKAKLRKKAVAEKKDTTPVVAKKDIVQVKGFRMFNDKGETTDTFQYGDNINIEFQYTVKQKIDRLVLCFTLRNAQKMEIFMSDKRSDDHVLNSELGKHTVKLTLKNVNLLGGKYLLSGEMWDNDSILFIGYASKIPFYIKQDKFLGTGISYFDHVFENR